MGAWVWSKGQAFWLVWLAVAGLGCGESGSRVKFLENPILGGELVETGDFMEVVLLGANAGGYSFSCTGTLISRRVVLTAAHCVDADGLTPSGLSVRFGNSQNESTRVQVDEFLIHPSWDPDRTVRDIALIRLAEDPPQTATPVPHLPASLAITDDDVGVELTFAGFGVNYQGYVATKLWMTAALYSVCTRTYGCGFAHQNTICIEQEPTGICSGDSGGPVFIERSGVRYVAGVNSYSGYDPQTGQSCLWWGCASKVDAYQSWIDDFVGDPDGSPCQEDRDCVSNSCAEGICCSEACLGGCKACDLPGQVGTCVALPDGTLCPDPNLCNGDETCVDGRCEAAEELVCEDGVACTKNLCDPADGCVFRPDALACFDDNECTRDQCDAQTGCQYEDLPDGSPCGLKGKCLAGACREKTGGSGCGCGLGGEPLLAGLFVWLALLALAGRRMGRTA